MHRTSADEPRTAWAFHLPDRDSFLGLLSIAPGAVCGRLATARDDKLEAELRPIISDPQTQIRRVERARLAEDLRHDPATVARASEVVGSLVERPEVRRAFGDVISAGRRLLLEMGDDPDGELRTRLTAGLAELGRRLDADDALVGEMVRRAASIAAEQGYAQRGYRTVFNCNADAGQTVFHIHLHVLGGRPMTWPPG